MSFIPQALAVVNFVDQVAGVWSKVAGLFGFGKKRSRGDEAAQAERDRAVEQRMIDLQNRVAAEREQAAQQQAELARKAREDTEARLEGMARQHEQAVAAAQASHNEALRQNTERLQTHYEARAHEAREAATRMERAMDETRQLAERQAALAAAKEREAEAARVETARLRAQTDAERCAAFDIERPADILDTNINIALCGQSGSGKSSTVNAVMGQEVAAVNVIQQTMFRQCYNIPRSPVKLFDLPGAGTPEFPLDTYYYTQGLKYFDIVLIMCANRFTEADLEIARLLTIAGVPYRLVRNMTGQAVANNARRGIDEATTVATIRSYLCDYLVKIATTTGFDAVAREPVYLIDSNNLDLYDGPAMLQWATEQVKRDRFVQ